MKAEIGEIETSSIPTPEEMHEKVEEQCVEYVDIFSYGGVIEELRERGQTWTEIQDFFVKEGIPCKYNQIVYVGKLRRAQREKHQEDQDEEQDAIIRADVE